MRRAVGVTGRTVQTTEPATGSLLAQYAAMDAAGVDAALAATFSAQPSWVSASTTTRATVLRRAAALLRERAEDLATLASREMGKPITEARAEVEKCAWVCEHYAQVSPDLLADREVVSGGSRSWLRHDPLGVVMAVMPWNFPYWQVFRYAAPTLMAGNACLLKHAPNVTGGALLVESLFRDAGLPDNVFTALVVAEADVPKTVDRLVADDRVAAVTLTGSNRAGEAVAAAAGRVAKKSLLELGGSDPFVVLADADLDVVVPRAVAGRFLNSGQSCMCAKRFIVHEQKFDEFVDRFALAVRELRVGDPLSPDTQVGPLARPDLVDIIDDQVRRSVANGARVVVGGGRDERGPAWYRPTVLVDVTLGMPVMAEETFGPVAPVLSVENDEDALAAANATPYGLGASVWSADIERALAVGSRIQSGTLFVNANTTSDPRMPFGGIKRSGYGRELGDVGATEFTNLRSVVIG